MNRKLKRLAFSHLRLILALAVDLLTLIEALSQVGWLHPWLFSERRKLRVHWVGERRRSLRPVHALPPVMLAEMFLLLSITWLSPLNAFYVGVVGNLVIVAAALSPVLLKNQPSRG